MLDGLGAQSIFYSSNSNPNELTDNADLEFAAKNNVSHSTLTSHDQQSANQLLTALPSHA
jgi:hypothetical protein